MGLRALAPERQIWLAAAIGIFLVALAARVGYVLAFGPGERIYDSNQDQYTYVDLASSLLAGRGYQLSFGTYVASAHTPTAIQPPTYPLFITGVFTTFGESLLAVRLAQALIGALTCVATLFIGGLGVNFAVGVGSGLFTAIYPLFVMYTRSITTETLYTLLLALVVLIPLILLRVGPSRWLYLTLGLLLALLFLTRPEAILFFPLLLGLLIVPLRRRQQPLRQLVVGVALAGLAFGLLVTPWVLYTWRTQGEPLLLPNKRWGNWESNWLRYQNETNPQWSAGCTRWPLECAIPDFDRLSELERDRYTVRLLAEFVREHPGVALRYAASRVLMSYPVIPRELLPPPLGYHNERERPVDGYAPDALDDFPLYLRPVEQLRVWLFRLLLLLSVAAAILALRRREWFLLLPGAMVLTNVVIAFITQGRERYRLPVDLYLIILAVYAVATVIGVYRQKRQRHEVAQLGAALER